MSEDGDRLQSFQDKWLAAAPEQALGLTFLPRRRRETLLAFACLQHEWTQTVYATREPQVAGVKLNWWAQEIESAHAGQPRHPLITVLMDDARAQALPPSLWLNPIAAGLRRLESGPARDFLAQLDGASEFHAALAGLETALWFGADAEAARAAKLATLGYLTGALAHLRLAQHRETIPAALPMDLLARHQLGRERLFDDSPARRAAARDQVLRLRDAYARAARADGPLSVPRYLSWRLDERRLKAASCAERPLDALVARHAGPALVFQVWRHARESRRHM